MTDSTRFKALIELHRAGRFDEAESGYRRIITESGDPNAMQLLATLLQQKRRYREALSWIDRALRHIPPNDALMSNRAAILLGLGEKLEALEVTGEILARNPGHTGARRNRLLAMEALAEEEPDTTVRLSWCQRYIEAGGDAPEAWLNYGNTLQRLGRAKEAAQAFERAHMLDTSRAYTASASLISRHFLSDATTGSLCEYARRIADSCYSSPARSAVNGDPLVWGFYSPRFGAGPIASLVLPVLRALADDGIRIVLLAGYRHDHASAAPFHAVAHSWHDVGELDDEAMADIVKDENIGVLFDLCGHAPGNRLAAFASRLAPLQVSWGDWFLTTGLEQMDLFLGDSTLTPPGEQLHFSEEVTLLPYRFSYNLPDNIPAQPPEPPVTPVFASLNRLSKLTDATLDCWSGILNAIPESRLLLRAEDLAHRGVREYTASRFEAFGVAPTRLEMRPFADYATTLQDYREVSVALDPFPFTGCVTSFDALAMGVPLVTLQGNSPVARQGASILKSLGLENWIAGDTMAYSELATTLALPDKNREARRRLRNIHTHSVLNSHRFARNLREVIMRNFSARRSH